MRRWLRVVATLVVTALAVTYIVLKIDLGKTLDILGSASVPWLLASVFLTLVTVPPQAWRWQQLLAVRGVHEGVPWLTRTYFVSYAWGQILPTAVGGDASRIIETLRRHPGQGTPITGSVLLERALGGAVTLLLAGVGFLLAIGRYPIGAYLWPEAIFVTGTILAGIVFFSRTVRRRLAFALPVARRFRIERPARAVYEGIHGYRDHPGTLLVVCAVSVALLPYIVLGPLLFLVMLVPFTVNGLGVREAFFVSFLGNLGVDPDAAFACGFLFFVMTIMLALPGLAVILWEQVFNRPAPRSKGAMPERSG
jgi:uncharacterized membrane protein YbhN (UPF0104 family)